MVVAVNVRDLDRVEGAAFFGVRGFDTVGGDGEVDVRKCAITNL